MSKFAALVRIMPLIVLLASFPCRADEDDKYMTNAINGEVGGYTNSEDGTKSANAGFGASYRLDYGLGEGPTKGFAHQYIRGSVMTDQHGSLGLRGNAEMSLFPILGRNNSCNLYLGGGVRIAGETLYSRLSAEASVEAGPVCNLSNDVTATLGVIAGGSSLDTSKAHMSQIYKGLRARLAVGRKVHLDAQLQRSADATNQDTNSVEGVDYKYTSFDMYGDVAISRNWRIGGDVLIKRGSLGTHPYSGAPVTDGEKDNVTEITVRAAKAF